jgi:plastocyanin
VSRDARSRVTMGIGIPLMALLFLGGLILAFSRILLVVPESMAPWVALLFAVNILVGCALAATIRGTRGFAFLITILVATILFGGVAGAFLPEREVHNLAHEEAPVAAEGGTEEQAPSVSEEPSPAPTEPPAGGGGGGGGESGAEATVVAQGLAFDTDRVTVPGEGEAVVVLDNREAVPHNFAVYASAGGEAIFQGEVVTGPAQVENRFPAPAPGDYHFQCDIHPTTMSGTLTVE